MPIDTNEIYFLAFVSVSYASLAAGFAVQYSRLPIERPALWPATVAWFWLILGGLQLGSKSISIFAHGYRALACRSSMRLQAARRRG